MNQSVNGKSSVFSKLFNRQKEKVQPKENVSNVLRQFADEDLKKIAVVIDEWLKKDESEQSLDTQQRLRRYKGK